MAPRNTPRVEAVKRLRGAAGRLGVERCADNASRAKVEAMYQATSAAAGSSEVDQQDVQAAWEAYQARLRKLSASGGDRLRY